MEQLTGYGGGKRLAASMIDNTLAIPLAVAIAATIPSSATVVRVVFLVLTYLLYFIVQEAIWWQTLGKRMMGLVVLASNGDAPGWGGATIRALCRLVEVNPALLGGLPAALTILFSEKKQRIGDMAGNTVVVLRSDLESS